MSMIDSLIDCPHGLSGFLAMASFYPKIIGCDCPHPEKLLSININQVCSKGLTMNNKDTPAIAREIQGLRGYFPGTGGWWVAVRAGGQTFFERAKFLHTAWVGKQYSLPPPSSKSLGSHLVLLPVSSLAPNRVVGKC